MAFGASTINDIGGAVADLFAGMGAEDQGEIKAQGLRLTAQGTRITAQSTRLSAEGLRTKAQGDLAEASNYDLASDLALANQAFTQQSTRIQEAQAGRQETMVLGGQRAQVAGAGFASSGSALDIMRDSASQAALHRGVLEQQGLITGAGYEEQAKSFQTLAAAGRATAATEYDIADKTDVIAGQQDVIAGQQDVLAQKTQDAADKQAMGDYIGAALKGAAAVATVFI